MFRTGNAPRFTLCPYGTEHFGAACLAGYTIGAMPSLEEVKKYVKLKYVYEPHMSADEREERMARWLEAANRSRDWARKR